MLLPEAKPAALQIVSAAARQSGAPFGATGQVARWAITRVAGMRATAPAVSVTTLPAPLAASVATSVAVPAASLAAPAAPLSPEFQLLTEFSIQLPTAPIKPGRSGSGAILGCGSGWSCACGAAAGACWPRVAPAG